METVTVTWDRPVALSALEAKLGTRWTVEQPDSKTLVVHGPYGRVYLHPNHEVAPGSGMLLDYSDIELVKAVLEQIADAGDVIVDNDFGDVLPGDDFVRRVRADRKWDWRR